MEGFHSFYSCDAFKMSNWFVIFQPLDQYKCNIFLRYLLEIFPRMLCCWLYTFFHFMCLLSNFYFIFFKKPSTEDMWYVLQILGRKEGGREKEREASVFERNIDLLPPEHSPIGDATWNLDMCPDPASNLQPLRAGMMLQPTEPHRPGL